MRIYDREMILEKLKDRSADYRDGFVVGLEYAAMIYNRSIIDFQLTPDEEKQLNQLAENERQHRFEQSREAIKCQEDPCSKE